MDFKKIGIRNSERSLTSIIMAVLLGMGIFFGAYLYWNANATNAGLNINSRYSDTYANLTESQTGLDNNLQTIRDNFKGISEADSTYQAAWNGLKGLGNTLKLPINFINTIYDATMALISPIQETVPGWAVSLIALALIALMILVVLGILKGEQRL